MPDAADDPQKQVYDLPVSHCLRPINSATVALLEDATAGIVRRKLVKEDVFRQLRSGQLVCPRSKLPLNLIDSTTLSSTDGTTSYEVVRDVPVLISDRSLMDTYSKESAVMNSEYSEEHLAKASWFTRMRQRDYRTKASTDAMRKLFEGLPEQAVCVSVGGGPTRAHPRLINVNIGLFPNVDVVGDAHALPYADGSVDVLHCEAVFEHLHSPTLAAKEIARVLKPGGRVFVCTPFLQPYHGYPHHYQNFTLTGQSHLFSTAGLITTESGTCVGPVYTLRSLTGTFLHEYLPWPLNRIAQAAWAAISILIGPLDLLIAKSKNSHVLASTTYLLATKN